MKKENINIEIEMIEKEPSWNSEAKNTITE